MEDENIIEEVPNNELNSGNIIFYLPHRPVIRENSLSTKVRPVFDASARGRNGVSLNDCVATGPNLIPDLIGVLIKFRRWPVAIVSDIKKAFLQISVNPVDRDVHRFLWMLDGAIRVMRFTRVIFGNRASPFILNAVIKHHLKKYDYLNSRVIIELLENLYVDDWLTGADDTIEASTMMTEASKIMAECGMIMTKWSTNCINVLDKVIFVLDKCSNPDFDYERRVLGLQWDPVSDCFKFINSMSISGIVLNKRVVLSLIARLFDPLGFVAPFIMQLKIIFQNIWKMGIDWNSVLPIEICTDVRKWITDLEYLSKGLYRDNICLVAGGRLNL